MEGVVTAMPPFLGVHEGKSFKGDTTFEMNNCEITSNEVKKLSRSFDKLGVVYDYE